MAKIVFGEYAAFNTPGGIRFQKNSTLVSESSVPPEVVAYLKSKVQPEQPARPKPSPEESAKLRAESLAVKPELQASPEKLAADAQAVEDHLTADDFDTPPPPADDRTELGKAIGAGEPVVTNEQANARAVMAAENTLEAAPPIDPTFMEEFSIHTASMENIAQALYDRFGIYTVWLKSLPTVDLVNPLTGEAFTKYHLGIAYQAAIRAKNHGLTDTDPANYRKAIDQNRQASANFKEKLVPQPISVRENREANSFDFRTSPVGNKGVAQTEIVHEPGADGKMRAVQRPIIQGEESETGEKNGAGVRYDPEEDAPLVEPTGRMGRPIVRPDW